MHPLLARRLPALTAALTLLGSPQPAGAQEPTSEANDAKATAPAPAPAPAAAPSAPIRGPIVHVVVKNADPDKGPVKLARYRGARPTTVPAGNTVVMSTYFDELCTEPCDVAVDVSERPMFFFVRDGTPVSNTFRLNNLAGHITLKVQTTRRGLMVAGTLTLLFLVGIPMFIAATPKVWMAEGRPGPDLKFKRLWRARL
ncbi:hypothetical protein [Nannocystis sp.]|uniref:hypothetical protein n=1 Tax=Nannocystis sp. TaxID=1962667 RepID=UPI0025E02944|nr:hypothetical protein [Nannocystis sp.]MBK7826048.1 hypothetical protein [Nannocystis sp.]